MLLIADDMYYLEKRCPTANRIMDVEECELACNMLGIPLSGKTFKASKPCFKGGNGVCNQNGGHGGRSNMVCKSTGTHCRYTNIYIAKYNFFALIVNVNYNYIDSRNQWWLVGME